LEKCRKPLEGAFGFGGGPQDYSCHERFADDLEQLLEELADCSPTSEQIGEVLRYIYFTAPTRWESETSVYWVLLAVHDSTIKFIKQLDVLTAKALCDEYQRFYPHYKRLPNQNKVLFALQQRRRNHYV